MLAALYTAPHTFLTFKLNEVCAPCTRRTLVRCGKAVSDRQCMELDLDKRLNCPSTGHVTVSVGVASTFIDIGRLTMEDLMHNCKLSSHTPPDELA